MPIDVRERIYPQLKLTAMPLGATLYEPGDVMRDVYFPIDAIVSLMHVMEDGRCAEVSVIGNEGIIGVARFMGGDSTPSRAFVYHAGHGYRLRAASFKREFARNATLHHGLLRYIQTLIIQTAQSAACNRHHSIDQQLCRWLLVSLDRLSSNELKITQELIASMLGVRREGVTVSAQKLQAAGVIAYRRGRITILDRAELECRSCECYAVVKQETNRLLADLGRVRSERVD